MKYAKFSQCKYDFCYCSWWFSTFSGGELLSDFWITSVCIQEGPTNSCESWITMTSKECQRIDYKALMEYVKHSQIKHCTTAIFLCRNNWDTFFYNHRIFPWFLELSKTKRMIKNWHGSFKNHLQFVHNTASIPIHEIHSPSERGNESNVKSDAI